jgi:uracil-DNA glycosylase
MPEFDPGPVEEPFAALARDYPGPEVYPPADFRVEWGPVFHRGRLDGTAQVVVVGQDPGQHESIAHRILIGEAGQRAQGFLAKLGIESSYVMVNAYLYSVYGQSAGERHVNDDSIAEYRNRWLDALVTGPRVEVVITFGHLARAAFERWAQTPTGQSAKVHFEHLTHPTMPDALSKGDESKFADAMKQMLEEWNAALERLDQQLGARDVTRPLELYGEVLTSADHTKIPSADLPAGAPPWWSSLSTWADRVPVGNFNTPAERAEAKRATVVVTVPNAERPWHQAPNASG